MSSASASASAFELSTQFARPIECSICIPRVRNYHTLHTVHNVFMRLLGIPVDSVDFTQIGKKPGFSETDNTPYVKMAFVHFTFEVNEHTKPLTTQFIQWYTSQSDKLVSDPNCTSSTKFELYDIQNHCCPVPLHSTDKIVPEYWMCYVAKKPVKRTMMNIHQVVDNCLYLENMVIALQKKNAELEARLTAIEQSKNAANTAQWISELETRLTAIEQSKNAEKTAQWISELETKVSEFMRVGQNQLQNQLLQHHSKPTAPAPKPKPERDEVLEAFLIV